VPKWKQFQLCALVYKCPNGSAVICSPELLKKTDNTLDIVDFVTCCCSTLYLHHVNLIVWWRWW